MQIHVDMHAIKSLDDMTIEVVPFVEIEVGSKEPYNMEKIRALREKVENVLREGLRDAHE